jgi:hypothetical protein
VTFFKTQADLLQDHPKPADPDLKILPRAQILLQFDQRPIRLLLHS